MKSIDLKGKTAIVTGGGQGIGRAIATALHSAGANVVVNYFADAAGRNRELAEGFARELGERAVAAVADVRNPAELAGLVEIAVSRFGGLDFLVNNAGILRDKSFRKMTSGDWQDVIDTNLTGVFNACQAAAEKLRDGGAIVNVASLSAAMGFFGQANYASHGRSADHRNGGNRQLKQPPQCVAVDLRIANPLAPAIGRLRA